MYSRDKGSSLGIKIAAAVVIIFALWLAVTTSFLSKDTNDSRVVTEQQSAIVSYVIDGDTFILSNDIRVRLIGVDAPELGEPLYTEARERLRALVEGKTVILEQDHSEVDRYERLLRYVYVNGIFVNVEMVRTGFARAMTIRPDTRYASLLLRFESEAKRAQIGIWAE